MTNSFEIFYLQNARAHMIARAMYVINKPVCAHFCLWPFRFVAIPVCGRSGCDHLGLWPL